MNCYIVSHSICPVCRIYFAIFLCSVMKRGFCICMFVCRVKGNEEQNLRIGKKTKLKLPCEYSPSCLPPVGPFLLGSPLKQIISNFVMKHYKSWIQILHLILHFLFFIYLSRELLTVLQNGLLKQHTVLEIKVTASQSGWRWKGSLKVVLPTPLDYVRLLNLLLSFWKTFCWKPEVHAIFKYIQPPHDQVWVPAGVKMN